MRIAAAEQLHALPSVRERWPYLSTVIKDAPSYFRVIPMIGSVGCPYTCSFCIDATVDYEALDVDTIKADLRFIKEKMPLPVVAWHDPNFGVRFKEIMAALERSGAANDTLVFFTSDNGAPLGKKTPKSAPSDYAGNLPLRGGKAQVWEGGAVGGAER